MTITKLTVQQRYGNCRNKAVTDCKCANWLPSFTASVNWTYHFNGRRVEQLVGYRLWNQRHGSVTMHTCVESFGICQLSTLQQTVLIDCVHSGDCCSVTTNSNSRHNTDTNQHNHFNLLNIFLLPCTIGRLQLAVPLAYVCLRHRKIRQRRHREYHQTMRFVSDDHRTACQTACHFTRPPTLNLLHKVARERPVLRVVQCCHQTKRNWT